MHRPAARLRDAGPARFIRALPIQALPTHVRFLLGHAAIGVAAGWILAGAVLALDIANLRTLMFRGSDGLLALGLLLFGTAITFGSAAMGAAIMGLGRVDAPAPPQSGLPSGPPALRAAVVRVSRTRRHR